MAGVEEQFEGPLPYLGTFSKAAELSSFTAAAGELGLTQAAVSQRIQALEKELETALFERRGGRVVLTEAGRTLYGYAQQILELHRQAREAVTGRRAPVTGELLPAASSIPGEHLLPELLARFHHRYPGVRVRASVSDSLSVLADVEQGKVHLGLVGRKSDQPHLTFAPLTADKMVLVVPPGHRWARRRRVTLKQLRQEPLVVREPGSGSRWCLEQALAEHRIALADLSIALELGSNEAIKEAVFKGVGVAVLSELAVKKELEAGRLHWVRIADLALDRTIFLVWDRRRALPAPARLFQGFAAVHREAPTAP